MVSEPSTWVTQQEASRILGLGVSAVPKLIRRGLLHPRRQRPSLCRSEVEQLRDARAELSRLKAERAQAKVVPQKPTPPDNHPDWVLAAQLAIEMGVGGPWVVHQRARRGRLPFVVGEDGTRWFRRDLVAMAIRSQAATRSKAI